MIEHLLVNETRLRRWTLHWEIRDHLLIFHETQFIESREFFSALGRKKNCLAFFHHPNIRQSWAKKNESDELSKIETKLIFGCVGGWGRASQPQCEAPRKFPLNFLYGRFSRNFLRSRKIVLQDSSRDWCRVGHQIRW